MTANARGVTGRLDLLNRIRQLADERGDDAAFVFVNHRGEEEALSWRVLSATVSEQVRSIRQQAGPGSVITAPAQSAPTAVAVFLAVLAAGRTLFPLDPRNPAVSSQRLLDEVRRQGGPIDNIESLFRHDDPGPGAATEVPGSQGASAFAAGGYILASGGSTGLPKPIHRPGAPYYDPRNVPSALLRRTGWRNHQTQLLSGPLHHAAPFSRLIDGVLSGNTLVIPQIFKSDLILGVIERYRVEWMQLTPSNMQLLDDALRRHPDAFSSVRGVLHSAAPCPVDTKRTWINKLGGGRVFEMYASTENLGMTLCDGDEWLAHPGTVLGWHRRLVPGSGPTRTARTPTDQRDPRHPGATDGEREPELGIPQSAGELVKLGHCVGASMPSGSRSAPSIVAADRRAALPRETVARAGIG